jgi:hypothetical protein
MGGAHMTVYQPDSDFLDSVPKFEFEIINDNDIEKKYKQILEHRYTADSHKMEPTFADQQKGDGEYIVEFNDTEPSATIKRRHMRSDEEFDASLAALFLTD